MEHDVGAPEGRDHGIPVQNVALDPLDGLVEPRRPLVQDAPDGTVPAGQRTRQHATDEPRRARDDVHARAAAHGSGMR